MTSRDFAYWLQGYFEIHGGNVDPDSGARYDTGLDAKQVDIIKRHLAMVFVHEIDPSHGGKEKQDKLNEIHNPKPPAPLHGGNPIYRC